MKKAAGKTRSGKRRAGRAAGRKTAAGRPPGKAQAKGATGRRAGAGPRLAIIACTWHPLESIENAAREGYTYGPDILVLPVRCTGAVTRGDEGDTRVGRHRP